MDDLIDKNIKDIKKLNIKELKNLVKTQKLFEITKGMKKKDIIKKIEEIKKDYEDSESEETEKKDKIEEIVEKIEDLKIIPNTNIKFLNNKKYIILNNNILKDILDILNKLIEECKIQFTKTMIKIKTFDKSLTSYIDIQLANIYDKNTLEEDKNIVVNIKNLINILNCKKNDEKIIILLEEEDIIDIYFYQNENNYQSFKLRLLYDDLIDDDNLEQNYELENNFEIDSKYFTNICKQIKTFDNKIKLNYNNNKMIFSSNNETVSIVTTNIKNNNIKIDDFDLTFSLKNLIIFCPDKFSDKIKISFGEGPCEFCCILDNSEESYIKFSIGPIYDDDDDDEFN